MALQGFTVHQYSETLFVRKSHLEQRPILTRWVAVDHQLVVHVPQLIESLVVRLPQEAHQARGARRGVERTQAMGAGLDHLRSQHFLRC